MKKHKRVFQLLFLLFLIVGTIFIIRQQQTAPYRHDTGFIFGTVYHITYQSPDDLHGEIMTALNRVDNSLSTFNKTSTISKINRNADIRVDDMFYDVFTLAETVSKETGGAFDITVAPLVNAWGFGFSDKNKPTPKVIDSLKTIIGYEKVALKSGHVIKKDKRIMLDCSAIAKGYGVDVVAHSLKNRGVKNFMVEIGGEVVVHGISDKRVPWKIGVAKPIDEINNSSQELETVINITDEAMATSGNYRNFYYKGGRKYAHTIDPKTGYPVQHNILSSTVIAPDCATADAYATAFMVTGLDGARKILNRHPELWAYFICSDKNGNNVIWKSKDNKKRLSIGN